MKITIELTEEECAVYRKWNFLRMTSRASSMLEESVDYKDQDTMDLAHGAEELLLSVVL